MHQEPTTRHRTFLPGGRLVLHSPAVVVGYDGSASAQAALRYAAQAAAHRNRVLQVLSAHEGDPDRIAGTAPQALFREAAGLVHGILRAERVTFAEPPGPAGGALISASYGADLLVVGRGKIGAFGAALGSVALDVICDAGCPVVVVGDGDGPHVPHTGPVVVGVDLVADPTNALVEAFTEAQLRDRDLVVLHAWQSLVGIGLPRFLQPDRVPVRVEARLAETVRPFREKYPEANVTEVCRVGSAPQVLMEVGSAASLIVVGADNFGLLTGMLLGSVGQVLARRAPCPLLIARAHCAP
jgi:nucleotide-binding universal stress UspA family protein